MNTQEIVHDKKKHDYLVYIIAALHMKIDEFMEAVIDKKGSCYKKLIYRWSIQLFERHKSEEQAIEIIHRARMLFLIHKPKALKEKQLSTHYILRIMDRLTLLSSPEELQDMEAALSWSVPIEYLIKIVHLLNTHVPFQHLDFVEKSRIRNQIAVLIRKNASVDEIEAVLANIQTKKDQGVQSWFRKLQQRFKIKKNRRYNRPV